MGHVLELEHLEEDESQSWRDTWPVGQHISSAPLKLGPLQRLALVSIMSTLITPFLILIFRGIQKAGKKSIRLASMGEDYDSDEDDDGGCQSSSSRITPAHLSAETETTDEMKARTDGAPVKVGGSHPLLSPTTREANKSLTTTTTSVTASVGSKKEMAELFVRRDEFKGVLFPADPRGLDAVAVETGDT
ncbi:unnamed protein product [Notodromas monacha]|uniref:Uncharacterized protein n=1 Tax=Notodromas monacha TaxID=399045 RepID=A0A7R9C2D9_9CRUS|nr:unnamed protein product [Notodromas monacha]CAG0925058.1 unnamed protein product [Notodromas monacha]